VLVVNNGFSGAHVRLLTILKELIFFHLILLTPVQFIFAEKLVIVFFLELENSIFRCSRLKIPTLPDKIANTNGFLRDNHIFYLLLRVIF
jgi:hypothetical protein